MSWLGGTGGLVVVAVVALAAGTAVAYAVLARLMAAPTALARAVEPYAGTDASRPTDSSKEDARLAGFRHGLDRAAAVAQLGTILTWTETRLDQANLALRAPEALFLHALGVIVGGAAAFFLGGHLVGLVVFLGLLVAPPAILNIRAEQRLKLFTAQLPDALVLTASSLKAGYSFLQGIEAVSQEVREPMAGELRRVMAEARLGRPVEDALEDCAARMKSPDFEWAVKAVGIQREVGGNLAELLETVAETMVERERLRRDVRSLTAEGRMSAIVLGVLPLGVGVTLYVVNPTYIRVLIDNTGGRIALIAAAIGMVVGFIWMNRVIDVDM